MFKVMERLREHIARWRMPAPTPQEQQRIDLLRRRFEALPVLTPEGAAPSEATWIGNRNRLRELVLTQDPRRFLTWDIIRKTMFLRDGPSAGVELAHLRSRADWDSRWREAIRETDVGAPARCNAYPESSGNLIHHAYHVCRFEEQFGVPITRLGRIVEFGGGYGSLCRLIHNLGYQGRYTIYDLPPFSALQEFFLSSLTLPVGDVASAGIRCLSSLKEFTAGLSGINTGNALFIATWSLSETPDHVRAAILPLVSGFGAFLIAYQEQFGEQDNYDQFGSWRMALGDVDWRTWHIDHLPGNHYLMGRRRAALRAAG